MQYRCILVQYFCMLKWVGLPVKVLPPVASRKSIMERDIAGVMSLQISNILAFKNNILAFLSFSYALLCSVKQITHNSIITYHEKNFN